MWKKKYNNERLIVRRLFSPWPMQKLFLLMTILIHNQFHSSLLGQLSPGVPQSWLQNSSWLCGPRSFRSFKIGENAATDVARLGVVACGVDSDSSYDLLPIALAWDLLVFAVRGVVGDRLQSTALCSPFSPFFHPHLHSPLLVFSYSKFPAYPSVASSKLTTFDLLLEWGWAVRFHLGL